METITVPKEEQLPTLSPAFTKKVKKLMQAIQSHKVKELQHLSTAEQQSLLRGLQDVLEGRVTKA